MFDFGDIKNNSYEEESSKEKQQLDIGTLLKNIDLSNFDFYDSLEDEEKKQFQPYTALRWVSALDDSLSITYKAKDVENVFGKWSSGGKEAINELKDEMNETKSGCCISVSKYEHAKFDWRIKFSTKDAVSADFIKSTLMEMGIKSYSTESLVQKETAQYQLMLLNDMVNENFWEIQKHPELVYSILCSVQSIVGGIEFKRTWLPFCKGLGNINSSIYEIMQKQCTSELSSVSLDIDEYIILLNSYTDDSFKNLLDDLGYQDSEKKSLLQSYKSEMKKYGK